MFMLPIGRLEEDIEEFVTTAPAAGERRRQDRENSNDLSEIITESGKTVIGCVVHNISSSGAMLELTSSYLPKRFVLSNHVKNTKVVCKVVWQCGRLAGVEFLTPLRRTKPAS